MRIVLVLSSMAAGGAERVIATLANAWAARGHDVLILATFSGGGQSFYELDSRVKLVFLANMVRPDRWWWSSRIQRLWLLRRSITKWSPDVVVSFLPDVNVACVLAMSFLAIPLVVCERTDPFARSMPRHIRLAQRLAYPRASAVVVQTEAVRQKFLEKNRRVRIIEVVPNPIPATIEAHLWPSRARPARKIIAVGRLVDGKQFDLLIELFAKLLVVHADCTLRIVGDGPLRGELEKKVERLGLVGRVEFAGLIQDIIVELEEADIFAMTSRYEGFPNVLLEAMASGLPCIAMDCPSGPAEISGRGTYARLIPLGDSEGFLRALCDLISDDDARNRLGVSARLSVLKQYSVSEVLDQWHDLFTKVVH